MKNEICRSVPHEWITLITIPTFADSSWATFFALGIYSARTGQTRIESTWDKWISFIAISEIEWANEWSSKQISQTSDKPASTYSPGTLRFTISVGAARPLRARVIVTSDKWVTVETSGTSANSSCSCVFTFSIYTTRVLIARVYLAIWVGVSKGATSACTYLK